jgi:hypothetical protein
MHHQLNSDVLSIGLRRYLQVATEPLFYLEAVANPRLTHRWLVKIARPRERHACASNPGRSLRSSRPKADGGSETTLVAQTLKTSLEPAPG